MRESGPDINGTYFPVDRNADCDSLFGYEPAAAALHRAVRAKETGVVKALLGAGADINARNENGQTALFVYDARRFFPLPDATKMLKMLIDCGIDLNAQDDAGHTALMYYAILGLSDLAEFLIDAGTDLNIRNNNGRTALEKFGRMGICESARLLRNAGAEAW